MYGKRYGRKYGNGSMDQTVLIQHWYLATQDAWVEDVISSDPGVGILFFFLWHWKLRGGDSVGIRRWDIGRGYFRSLVFKRKKANSPQCMWCPETEEDVGHTISLR